MTIMIQYNFLYITMIKSFSIFIFVFCLFFSISLRAEDCFMLSKNNKIIHQEGVCDKRYTPASTFKIAISLMGFDSGILIDEANPLWNFKPCYVDWLDRWKQAHNPKMWLANSCVWYSQIITKKLGVTRFAEYTKRLNYGNCDVSGDKNTDNGLTNCWLSSSLLISPKEQINFINNLILNKLPINIDAQERTKNIMFQETMPNNWRLYGKTGNGSQLDENGIKIKDRQVGWFVGFISKGKENVSFVYLIIDNEKQDTYASLRAKEALKNKLEKIVY